MAMMGGGGKKGGKKGGGGRQPAQQLGSARLSSGSFGGPAAAGFGGGIGGIGGMGGRGQRAPALALPHAGEVGGAAFRLEALPAALVVGICKVKIR